VPGPFEYHVLRDGVALPGCISTHTACADIPPAGAHFYTAYTVDRSGVASPLSAATEADMPAFGIPAGE
jgi:hypothetical protein